MAENVKIILSGDASSLVAALKQSGASFEGLTEQGQKAGKGMESLSSQFGGLARELGATLALGTVVHSLEEFVTGSFNAAAAAERLGGATNKMAGEFDTTGGAIVRSIQEASGFTIDRMSAMEAANKMMMFGIVQDKKDFAELTQIAVTLGRAMGQDARKSLDDLSLALGRNSPLILDNLGIQLKLTDAYNTYAASLGKTADQLTETEKKEAFLNAALIAGREKMAELGGITEDTASKQEQYTAAVNDFTESFGALIQGPGGEGIDFLTNLVRALDEGAIAWNDNLGPMQAFFDALTTGAEGTSIFGQAQEAMQGGLETLLTGWGMGIAQLAELALGQDAVVAAANAAAESYAAQTEQVNANSAAMDDNATSTEELIAKMKEEEDQRTALMGVDADYFNSLKDLQTDALAAETDHNAKLTELNQAAADKRTDIQDKLTETLKTGEESYFDARNRLIDQAQTKGAAWLNNQLAQLETHYAEKKAKQEQDAADELAELDKTQAEKVKKINDAYAKEKEEQAKHLQELKLKTALHVLEVTGKLEELTGIAGLKASDAYDLVTAGVIRMDGEFASATANAMAQFTAKQAEVSANARANQSALETMYKGSFQNIARAADAAFESIRVNGQSASDYARTLSATMGRGYASGGSFTVGGYGGADSVPVGFMATPGERVTVTPPTTNYNLNVTSNLPSAGIVNDFNMMRAMAGR